MLLRNKMTNYWLVERISPISAIDKVNIRRFILNIKNKVFDFIDNNSKLKWDDLCLKVKNYVYDVLDISYKKNRIAHFSVATYNDSRRKIIRLSIQPTEYCEYIHVDFILSEI